MERIINKNWTLEQGEKILQLNGSKRLQKGNKKRKLVSQLDLDDDFKRMSLF